MQHVSRPYLREDFISRADCETLIKLIRAYACREKGCKPVCCTNKRTVASARQVLAHGFPDEANLLAFISEKCSTEVTKAMVPLTPIYISYMVLAGNYKGDNHVPHADNRRYDARTNSWVPNHTPDRVATCGVYLNQHNVDFTGGELLFPSMNISVKPAPGLLVAFPSDERFVHEVQRVTAGSRYSIFMWFTENPQKAERLI